MGTRNVDIVVIGSGVAGLAAALEAAKRGARVLVVEAESQIGGASAMSGAACCIVGSPEQKAMGVEDSVEVALADWTAFGGPSVDLDWAIDYLTHSRVDVHDYLSDLGIRWSAPALQEGNSLPRWHMPEQFGIGILTAMLTAARGRGVELATGVRVTSLLIEGAAVVGVAVEGMPEISEVRAGATVVATGGFANDRDRLLSVSERLRGISRWLNGGAPTATGSGHALLEGVGAGWGHLENVWVYPNATPDPTDPSGRRGVGIRNLWTEIWVNLNGERFANEHLRGGKSGTNALLAQPGQTCWTVFDGSDAGELLLIDNEYWASPSGPNPEAMATFYDRSRHAARADSLEELAEKTGLPLEPLRRSIDDFNHAIRAGLEVDPVTGKRLAGMHEVGPGGFVAIQQFPMAQKTLGGVRTDLQARVLRPDGSEIPGLYAAGEVAGMAGGSINGAAGLEGTMFGPSLYSGLIAGRNVPVATLLPA